MHPFNQHFSKIFVLALQDDLVRQNQIREQLRGVEYEFIWGPNIQKMFPYANCISDIPNDFFTQFDIDKASVLHWSLGGLGCALGHRLMMKKAIDSKESKFLLLEDDILLMDNTIKYFDNAIKYVPANWELLYLGFEYPSRVMNMRLPLFVKRCIGFFKKIDIIGLKSWVLGKSFFPITINEFIQKSGVCIGGHAYALTLESATKLFKVNSPLRFYSDPLLMQNVYHQNIISYNLVLSIINQNKVIGSYTE
jgi:glycosyl transferase family 25